MPDPAVIPVPTVKREELFTKFEAVITPVTLEPLDTNEVAVTIPVTLTPLEVTAGAIRELIVPIPVTVKREIVISFAAPASAKLNQVVPLNPWNLLTVVLYMNALAEITGLRAVLSASLKFGGEKYPL